LLSLTSGFMVMSVTPRSAPWVDGDRLRYRAPEGALDPELRAQAAAARGALIALVKARAFLPADRAAWPEGARHDFEERAGVLEFDGGMPRPAAGRKAERLVRVAHARAVVHRSALVVTPVAAAVATGTSGNGQLRRP
jgi:hypothetical protein